MNDYNNKLIGISDAASNTSGQQSSGLPGDDLADTAMQQAENLPGDDFERQAEDERRIEEESIRRALDEAEANKLRESQSRAARAIYEAVNGTPEEIEERRTIIKAGSNRRLEIMRERIGRNAEAFTGAIKALEKGGL